MWKNIFFSLLILSVSCAKTSDRYREGSNAGQKSALTVEEEKKLTQEAMPQMKKDYPSTSNKELQSYITRLGQKLVAANKLNGNPYHYNFTVVESNQINAFALPAGETFITIPIIAMADSEAEIAGVIGHEIGHVVARHTAERMEAAKGEQKKMIGFGALGAVLGAGAGYFASSKLCKDGDSACKLKYTGYGGAGGAAVGVMAQKYGFMKNSQEDELESDRIGFRYAVVAGYNKDKVGDFYSKLYALEKESKKGQNAAMSFISDAMSSHPPSKSRVDQAAEMRGSASSQGGIDSGAEFARMKKIAQDIYGSLKK